MFTLKLKRKHVFKFNNGRLHKGDCIKELKKLPENSIDGILTDVPYNISFMGKKNTWDTIGNAKKYEQWNKTWAKEALRVLKPGGHILVFGGSRTYHRVTSGLEDAGFEIRDTLQYLYGSAMPHGYNVGQSLEKKFTIGKARRKDRDLGGLTRDRYSNYDTGGQVELTHPIAIKYQGYNSALKPAFEPLVLARKPLSEKNLADNILKWGVGALNIDACRVPLAKEGEDKRLGGKGSWKTEKTGKYIYEGGYRGDKVKSSENGRYPANVIWDGSQEVEKEFAKFGKSKGKYVGENRRGIKPNQVYGKFKVDTKNVTFGGSGTVSRFFYSAKVSNKERGGSNHTTQKPIAVCRYFIRLIMPPNPNAIVLDPFMGSNSTGIAANKEGFKYIGIEKDRGNFEDAIKKTKHHLG